MSAVDSKVLKKLKKILALTTSPSEGEAQAATETLARLLEEHNLSMSDLDIDEDGRPKMKHAHLPFGKGSTVWRRSLGLLLCEPFFVQFLTYKIPNRTVALFVGRPDNVEAAAEAFRWLEEQIVRLSSESLVEYNRNHPQDKVNWIRWQLSFGQGVCSRLNERLQAMSRTSESTALVVQRQSEVNEYVNEVIKPGKGPRVRSTIHRAGYRSGLSAGDRVTMKRQEKLT